MASGDSIPFFAQRTFCLITGASRGIGQKIAVEFAKKFDTGSVLLLFARDEAKLLETKNLITGLNISVLTKCVDLSQPDASAFCSIISDSLEHLGLKASDFKHAVIVHNAGSIGNVSKTAVNLSDLKEWQDYYSLNLFSTAILNSQFLNIFPKDEVNQRSVINISSLCGIKPFKTLAQYGSAKASRNMFFKVMAEEEPSLNVLNYAPGPVDTDMVSSVIKDTADEEIRKSFVSLKESQTILQPEQTVAKLILVLEERKYKSGDHVDYFDD